jgi:hypothetical protein
MANPNSVKKPAEEMELMVGEAMSFTPTAEQTALAELLLLRCGDSRLIGSQVIEQAKICGEAVKVAFEELNKISAPQE